MVSSRLGPAPRIEHTGIGQTIDDILDDIDKLEGMESIIGALGTQEFARVRLGVSPGHRLSDGASYLLAPMKKSQLAESAG